MKLHYESLIHILISMWGNDVMGLKERTVTPSLLRKYIVLRYLYIAPRTSHELIEACPDIEPRHIISAVANLLSNHAIKKESVPMESRNASDEFFNENPEPIKMRNQYVLTDSGLRKLGYWDWKWQLYTEWKCPWSDSFNENYYEEISRVIIEDLKLPHQ
jgi:hypothetical protein